MSINERNADPAAAGPLHVGPTAAEITAQDSTAQEVLDRDAITQDAIADDPSVADPMADEKVRLQLAIFEVTRDADGRSLSEIQEMLRAAFARRGVETPPGTWLESVASSAFYGEPYIVNLPAAVIADTIVPAPKQEVRERLAAHRELQQEKLPAGIFPSEDEWNIPGTEATGGSTRTLSLPRWESGAVLALAALAAVAVAAVVAIRAGAGGRRTVRLKAQPAVPVQVQQGGRLKAQPGDRFLAHLDLPDLP
ncbi:hypothetical protein QF031_000917 [Pseudarthrobacter defluvii]|uniref:hypothetical protein n=1 Tax=Pseudarthrobacter defluvii TaxID=410837 RepID=UPI0027803D97|nr:hypothetical protein [Pseudarthrobacter defluvii]MDQ0768168.1 hypothetical protein [Pseudarthrobacter defluvii]